MGHPAASVELNTNKLHSPAVQTKTTKSGLSIQDIGQIETCLSGSQNQRHFDIYQLDSQHLQLRLRVFSLDCSAQFPELRLIISKWPSLIIAVRRGSWQPPAIRPRGHELWSRTFGWRCLTLLEVLSEFRSGKHTLGGRSADLHRESFRSVTTNSIFSSFHGRAAARTT